MEKFSMTTLVRKLNRIGGDGPFKQRDWRLRSRLGWHSKSKSTIRHLLYGEQRPSLEEAREIEAAHFKFCAEKAAASHDENRKLFASMRIALTAMEQSDPEFFGPQIEEVRALLVQHGDAASQTISED